MKINKTSTKSMVQGYRNGNDLKKIIFSNDGNLFISIDRTYGVKLWDKNNQILLRQFNQLIAHHAVFTPDDQRLILIGKQILHVFNLTNTQEINRLSGGFNMGTGDCSPDNMYFVYSNGSDIFIRDLITFSLLNRSYNSICEPYFISFNTYKNELLTSSLINGELCKWNLQNLQIQANNTLNSIISDLDFTQKYMIVSSDRNRRQIFILNPIDLSIIYAKILPKSFFLDFNTQIQSTYNKINNLLLSVAIPGNFIFMHNANTFQYLGTLRLPLNTYTIASQQNTISIGGQVANRQLNRIQDQILFYNLLNNCTSFQNTQFNQSYQVQCLCLDNYIWNRFTKKCQIQNCTMSQITNYCQCPIQQQYNKYTLSCQLNCSSLAHTISRYPYGQGYCSCSKNYVWNSTSRQCQYFSCRNLIGSTGRLINVNTCQCFDKFYYDHKKQQCIIDCTIINNTLISNKFSHKINVCECQSNYTWNQKTQNCDHFKDSLPQPPPSPPPPPTIPLPIPSPLPQPPSNSQQIPIIAIIIPIVIIFICVIIVMICCYCRYKKNKQTSSISQKRKSVITSQQYKSNKISQKNNSKILDKKQLKQNQQNYLIYQKQSNRVLKISNNNKLDNIHIQQILQQKQNIFCNLCLKKSVNCITPCQHYFHSYCLIKYFNKNNLQCPLCFQALENGINSVKCLSQQQNDYQIENKFIIDEQNSEKILSK